MNKVLRDCDSRQRDQATRPGDGLSRAETPDQISYPSAQTAAEETIHRYQIIELTGRETEAFQAALERPPDLSPKMREGLRNIDRDTMMSW